MKTLPISIYLLLVCLLSGTALRAGVEPVVSVFLPGEFFVDHSLNTSYVAGATFSNNLSSFNSASAPYGFPSNQQVRQIDNLLQLSLNPNGREIIDFPFELEVDVAITKYSLGASSPVTVTSQLVINYDPTEQTKWIEKANFHFTSCGKVEHKILAVNITSNGSLLTDRQKQLVEPMVELRSDIIIERYFPFNQQNRLIMGDLWSSLDVVNNELVIEWLPLAGAELYDLEYAWVDAYDSDGRRLANVDLYTPKYYDLNRNSTRIQTAQRSYRIPLVFEMGYLYFRVRGVGKVYDAALNEVFLLPGLWSNGYNSLPTGPEQCPNLDCSHIFVIQNPHTGDSINWQRITAFAEEAKRKDVVSYLDGTYRNRQSVTGLSTDRMTLVGGNILDHQGRPAIQVLPVPRQSATLQFNKNLNEFSAGVPYDHTYFDESTNCATQYPQPLATTSGASRYYSPSNPDQSEEKAFIPDAGGYPFAQVEYTPDNTGRIRRQGGPGPQHRLGSGHETKYFYGTPSQEEGSRLFGVEFGKASHYKKNVVQDPNGQFSVSFHDLKGNVIATGLTGTPPTNVDQLDSYNTYPMSIDLMAFNREDATENALVTTRTFTVTLESDYDFRYDINQASYRAALCNGIELCLDCVYDLDINIVDNYDCDNAVVYQHSETVGPFRTVGADSLVIDDRCNRGMSRLNVSASKQFSVRLKPGSYTIVKQLKVNEFVVDEYVEHYLRAFEDRCGEVYEEMLANQLAQVDSSDCFIEEFDPTPSPCETARIAMLADVSPGGQYGLINFASSSATDPLSVFNTNNKLAPTNAHWQNPVGNYRNSDGSQSFVNGLRPEQLSLPDFILYWQDSWAEALLPYHPEYCYLTWCEDLNASYVYDHDMRIMESYNAAYQAGYFDPLTHDPYFEPWSSGNAYRAEMSATLGNYNRSTSNMVSMEHLAIMITLTKNGRPATPTDVQSWWNANRPSSSDPIADDVWENYRALYLAKKEYYQYLDRTDFAMNKCQYTAGSDGSYNECIGADPFNWRLNNFGAGLLGSKFLTEDQPCSSRTFLLYKNKDKRFPSAYDIPADFDPYGDPATVLQQGSQWANTIAAENCGGCLCNRDIQQLINGILQDRSFLANGGFVKMSKDYAQRGKLRLEMAISTPIKSIKTELVGNELRIRPFDGNDRPISCPIRLVPTSGTSIGTVFWEQAAQSIDCIFFDFSQSSSGEDYAKANILLANGQMVPVQLIVNKECALWESCDPPGELCPPTAQATSLGGLFAQLLAEQSLVARNKRVTDFLDNNIVAAFPSDPVANTGIIWDARRNGNRITAQLGNRMKQCEFSFLLPNRVSPNDLGRLVSITPDNTALDPTTGYTNTAILQIELLNGSDVVEVVVSNDCFPFSFCLRCPPETSGPGTGLGANLPATGIDHRNQQVEIAGGRPKATLRPNGSRPAETQQPTQLMGNPYCPTCEPDNYTLTYDSLVVLGTDTTSIEVTWMPPSDICDPCAPITDTLPIIAMPNPCVEEQILAAYANAHYRYAHFLDSLRTQIRKDYIRHCLAAAERFTVRYTDDLHHITLYYYDQANNLLKTIPPAGVSPLTVAQTTQAINYMRNGTGAAITPAHKMASDYTYNSLSQLRKQTIPDHLNKETNFWYDYLSRIVASQSPEQKSKGEYAYSLYDNLGRSVEAGVVERVPVLTDAIAKNETQFLNWISSGAKSEVTRSVYDEQTPALANQHFDGDTDNYRGRIARLEYLEKGTQVTHQTLYHYDIHGNVDQLVQDLELLEPKKMSYTYDLISGNVHQVNYQQGQLDQFLQRYAYDADNRLIKAESSRDGFVWDTEADYYYYQHGPLARLELGEHKVQGIDYAYTIHGWIKGVNSVALENHKRDIGQDGAPGSAHADVALDAGGYMLRYFTDDFLPIGGNNWEPEYRGTAYHRANRDLYNGNIQSMMTAIAPLQNGQLKMGTKGYAYTFDQLQRITSGRSYKGLDLSLNQWMPGTTQTLEYATDYRFDPNGNLLKLTRNATTDGGNQLRMDELGYHYRAGTNRLEYVEDDVPAGFHAEDIDDQNPGNYQYDHDGNLISDASDGMRIRWKANGKVESMKNTSGQLELSYDALGNRVTKKHTENGVANPTYTFYVLDVTGNVMSIYTTKNDPLDAANVHWESAYVYGGSRLAEERIDTSMTDLEAIGQVTTDGWYSYRNRGSKYYEFTEHRSNVLASLSDRKLPLDKNNDGRAEQFAADVWSAADYYPYGMLMTNRNESADDLRFGFQGQEMDNELRGKGNSINYKYRMHDPRLGRFFAVDPLYFQYPYNSQYAFSENRVVDGIEWEGLEVTTIEKGMGGGVLLVIGGSSAAGVALSSSGVYVYGYLGWQGNTSLAWINSYISSTYYPNMDSPLDLNGWGGSITVDYGYFLSGSAGAAYNSGSKDWGIKIGGSAGASLNPFPLAVTVDYGKVWVKSINSKEISTEEKNHALDVAMEILDENILDLNTQIDNLSKNISTTQKLYDDLKIDYDRWMSSEAGDLSIREFMVWNESFQTYLGSYAQEIDRLSDLKIVTEKELEITEKNRETVLGAYGEW